jgi:hypothetical protein
MQLFLMIVQLIPAIIKLVKQIEEEIPVPKQGAAKLNFVLDSVNSIVAESPDMVDQAVGIQKAVGGIVGAAVTMFKATGVFK